MNLTPGQTSIPLFLGLEKTLDPQFPNPYLLIHNSFLKDQM